MPQTNPFPSAKTPANVGAMLQLDASGNLLTGSGSTSKLNLVAGATLVKAGSGRICKVIVTGTASAGALAVNDCVSVAAVANPANELISIPFGSVTNGQILVLDFPCLAGIVVTVPTGCTAAVSFD